MATNGNTLPNARKFTPIRQYTLRGHYLATFSSRKAMEGAGFDYNRVRSCCENKTRTAHGYTWQYVGQSKLPYWQRTSRGRKNARHVARYSYDGKERMGLYPSIAEAARQIGGKTKGLAKCLAGEKKHYYGYTWRYADGKQPD